MTAPSHTLGELLKYVGDIRKNVNGDETPTHSVVEMSETSNDPRSLPFVLSFNNLTYSVKIHSKMRIPTVFGPTCRRHHDPPVLTV
ncbi:hypothetical protein HanRHA438_Chr17g0808101 [Helianthus annuus]|nr:hypothetical protein HanRHA438_Chr17g0808101 [Helianthus annuus]